MTEVFLCSAVALRQEVTIFGKKEKPGGNDLCLKIIYDINTNYINNALNHPCLCNWNHHGANNVGIIDIYAVFIAHNITSIVAISAATISLTASHLSLWKMFLKLLDVELQLE